MTTVGYGQTVPKSSAGFVVAIVLLICGVLYMAMPLGMLGAAFTEVWGDRDRVLLMRGTRHRLLGTASHSLFVVLRDPYGLIGHAARKERHQIFTNVRHQELGLMVKPLRPWGEVMAIKSYPPNPQSF